MFDNNNNNNNNSSDILPTKKKIGKGIRSSWCKNYVILSHQMPTLLFYHIILQHLIYQMFYNSILYIKIIFTTY